MVIRVNNVIRHRVPSEAVNVIMIICNVPAHVLARWNAKVCTSEFSCFKQWPNRNLRGCLHGGGGGGGGDPCTRKTREGGNTFRLLYMQKFRPKWLPSGEGKEE